MPKKTAGRSGDPSKYNSGKQETDRLLTNLYYNKKFATEAKKQHDMGYSNPLDTRFRNKVDKNGLTAVDRQAVKVSRMRTELAGKKAYQYSWIAKGAKANELAVKKAALKKRMGK